MYTKYLEICERLDDADGQALAHNFIGCAIQEKENLKLELVKSESGKNPVPESSVAEYERALYHHKKAAEKSGIEGRFICYTNLGLLCSTLSMWAKAAKNHKKALRCATVLENPRGQCAAVGNLGFLLYKRKKYEAAKACMIRYLQICRVINFMPGIARAHFYLGDIEAQFKRY
ncbi:hypothetical protein M758_6G074400 [Ceratodon purpureus]|uniref:Uncharacterized protein n=1 Tax=Ceratodon purpureus TaxID=3225 RepID=A0A8T0HIE5_CERPU|nr:hypothetical protein KC19_6G078900 [Ceratodon purpureus]KAG0613070.1 hypothetical protein M758_6G074400 [Ceratodon purpureus]